LEIDCKHSSEINAIVTNFMTPQKQFVIRRTIREWRFFWC